MLFPQTSAQNHKRKNGGRLRKLFLCSFLCPPFLPLQPRVDSKGFYGRWRLLIIGSWMNYHKVQPWVVDRYKSVAIKWFLSIDKGNRSKSINWIAVSNRYYRFFMVLMIDNFKSAIIVFWHDSTARITHPRVTSDLETITHRTFSLKPFVLYLITKTVRLIAFSSRRQVSREIHP